MLKSSNSKQSASIGHLRLLSIPPSENTPSSTPAFVATSIANTIPRLEPWLTRRPRSATPLTSRPQTTRSQAVLTPQPLIAPDILTSIPPPRKLSIPHREHPSPLKPLLPPNNFCWTDHPGLTTTRAPSPPPSSGWSAPRFLMRARQRLETSFKSSPNSSVSAKRRPATATHNRPAGSEASKITSANLTSRSRVINAPFAMSTHASEPRDSSTHSPRGPGSSVLITTPQTQPTPFLPPPPSSGRGRPL